MPTKGEKVHIYFHPETRAALDEYCIAQYGEGHRTRSMVVDFIVWQFLARQQRTVVKKGQPK
jgi:hypothetical protein